MENDTDGKKKVYNQICPLPLVVRRELETESDMLAEGSESVDRIMRGMFSKAGSGY